MPRKRVRRPTAKQLGGSGTVPSLAQSRMASLVAVSAAGPPSTSSGRRRAVQLRTVQPAETAASLADSLNGGPPIAPLPTDPDGQARAIAMLQPEQPVPEIDAAAVVATSGSTGAPKGVVLSRAAIRASVEATHARLGGVGDWVIALPPYYVAGLMVIARACLGGTRAVPVRSDLSDLPDVAGTLSERRYISLVPAQLDRALGQDRVTEALAGFTAVLLGGGPTSDGLRKRAMAAGIDVVRTYGMSETCGGCVYEGHPLPGVDVDIADGGQIMISSEALFTGYRLRPDLTREAVVDDRFRTQDRGRWQAGRLVVLGRIDDVVIVGGHKVDLVEVEHCVQRWADLQGGHGAAVAVPDPVWGTMIIAVSDAPGLLKDLQRAVCESLPSYAMPRELIFLDALPWLGTGKPDQVAIRSMIMEMLGERKAPV
jgi:O-succinylbenzoic acid--CoA ligase